MLIVVVAALVAPLVLVVLGRRAAAGAVLLVLLLTRVSDLGLAGGHVSAVSAAGLSPVAQAVLVALALLALARRARGAAGWRLGREAAPWLALAAYLAALLASSVWAVSGPLARGQALSLVKNLVIAFVLVDLLGGSAQARRLALWAIVAAGTAMAGLTVLQAATHTYAETYLGFAQAPVRQIVGTDQSFRSAGPIGDPNFYALVLAALVPVALMRVRDETRPLLRAAAGAAALLLGAGIVLTFSRGGLVALVAALVLFISLARVRPALLVACALVALPLLALVPATYRERIETLRQGDNSISRRVASQDVAVQMFVAHPLGGVGANNYAVSYLPYALRLDEPAAAEEPHNLYLAIAAETGVLGLGAFAAAIALVLARAWRSRAAALRAGDRAGEGIATACLLALATYLVGVAFLPIAYPRYLWTFVGLALALPAAALVPRARPLRHAALQPAGAP